MALKLPASARLGPVRRPSLPANALERGGAFMLIVERDRRPAHGGEYNVTRLYWRGRRYQVPKDWRRFL